MEAGRYALCLAVILIHVIGPARLYWQWVVLASCNAAVPFFFVAAGYFNRVGPGSPVATILRPVGRLLLIYLAWLLIYYLADAAGAGAWPPFPARALLTGGGAYHLWFLPALAVAQLVVGFGYRAGARAATGLLSLLLALLSLATGLYAARLGLPTLPGARLLAAPLYVFAGRLWAERRWRPRVVPAAAAFGGLWALCCVASGWAPLLTYGLGLAAFALALAAGDRRALRPLAALGAFSLGIYCVHLLLVEHLLPDASPDAPRDVAAKAVAVLLAATAASAAVATLPLAWRLVGYRRLTLTARRG